MGLERDDPVVRRRMSQKIQFILDSGTPAAPTDAELQQWLDDHADKYRIEPAYSLQQVYFDPARHGEKLEADIAAALRALEGGRTVTGDSTMLPARFDGSATDVARALRRGIRVCAAHGAGRVLAGTRRVRIRPAPGPSREARGRAAWRSSRMCATPSSATCCTRRRRPRTTPTTKACARSTPSASRANRNRAPGG